MFGDFTHFSSTRIGIKKEKRRVYWELWFTTGSTIFRGTATLKRCAGEEITLFPTIAIYICQKSGSRHHFAPERPAASVLLSDDSTSI